jgi:hypothetical protein
MRGRRLGLVHRARRSDAAGAAAGASTDDLHVGQGQGVELRSGEPPRIGNSRAIPLQVSFTGTAIPPVEQIQFRSASDAPATATCSATIGVTAVGAANETWMPIRIGVHGFGQELDVRHADIALGIPIDDRDRDAQEMRHIEWLASIASTQSPPPDPMVLNMYKNLDDNRKAALGHAFDRVFFEGRVGLFDVTCTYASAAPGSWNGEVRAAPVRINVFFEGHFLDQPAFRKR